MQHSRIWLWLSVACVAACAPAEQRRAAVDTKAEAAKLMETSRQWSALASTSKDPKAVSATWADDAVLMQEGLPTMRGQAAAEGMVEQMLKIPGFKIGWEPIEAQVSASGDMGYIIERSRVVEPDASGKPQTHEMRAVTVWRKDAKGEWRNVVDMSNAEVKRSPEGPR